jgi:DNA polymerase III subunit beta
VGYLLDVLANVDTDEIECALGDASSSALITVPGRPDFKYVVMPMRI